jgi:hypothetical protein
MMRPREAVRFAPGTRVWYPLFMVGQLHTYSFCQFAVSDFLVAANENKY